MKLWLLRPVEPCKWDPDMDVNYGFVVRAKNEISARKIAEGHVADEESYGSGRGVWTDPELTTCKQLTSPGSAGVIMKDFLSA